MLVHRLTGIHSDRSTETAEISEKLLVLGGAQPIEVATNLRYVMTGFTLFSSILNFIAIKWIYPLDKKTLAQMNNDLGRDV